MHNFLYKSLKPMELCNETIQFLCSVLSVLHNMLHDHIASFPSLTWLSSAESDVEDLGLLITREYP